MPDSENKITFSGLEYRDDVAAAELLRRNVKRFRGGLVFKAHRLFVSLNSRLESNKEEEEVPR